MNTILLEFPDEADMFLAYCREQHLAPESFNIIALWPNVQVILRRQGIRYQNTRPYFGNDSHKRILLKSEEWLDALEESVCLTDGSAITQCYNAIFSFHLRFYINYFLWLIEILYGLAHEKDVALFTFHTESEGSVSYSGPSLGPSDRYLTSVVRGYAAQHGIKHQEIRAANVPTPVRLNAGRRLGYRIGSKLLPLAGPLLQRIAMSSLGQGPRILVNTVSYNMDRLLEDLRKTFPALRCIWLQTSGLSGSAVLWRLINHRPADHFLAAECVGNGASRNRNAVERMEQSLRETQQQLQQRWKGVFLHEGVSFVEIVSRKIEQDLFRYLRETVLKSQAIRYVLEQTRPSLVITPYAAGTEAILGEWSRVLGIPSLSISHGSFTPPQTRPDEIEKYRLGSNLILTNYEYTALQTPWAERYISHFSAKCRPTPVRTGNLILAKENTALRLVARRELFGHHQIPNLKIVVYATTLKPRSALRFQIHETLDEHLAGIADLAQAVNAIDNARLVIKLHPAAALKEDEVALLVPATKSDRIRICCRAPFERILSAADLLVSYSSTCIEEAIQQRIPVLLYDPWDRYQHLSALRWGQSETPRSSPSYYLTDPKSLEVALRWILDYHNPLEIPEEVWREHIYPPEAKQEFLQFVGQHLGVSS